MHSDAIRAAREGETRVAREGETRVASRGGADPVTRGFPLSREVARRAGGYLHDLAPTASPAPYYGGFPMDCSTLTIARGRTPRRVREHPPSRPGGPARGADPKTLAASVLAQHGTTYSAEAGITLRDKPAPLFQLLVLSALFTAPILPSAVVASADQLFAAGWRTPQRLLASTLQQRVNALDRGGYRQRDQSSARFLGETAAWLQDQYGGDLRRVRRLARGDLPQMRRLLLGSP